MGEQALVVTADIVGLRGKSRAELEKAELHTRER
jgi:hypothetical protein